MAGPARKPSQRDASADLLTGAVGRFMVQARLGAGGMGEVYRAEDTKLRRSVALKRISPRLRGDAALHRRLLREAERASQLNDPHIAAIYDVLEQDGETFLVMEYVEGETLRRRLQEPLAAEEFLLIATQCAQAMAAAHERGILHCDLKPENIMITSAGEVKILDFGVAKVLPEMQTTQDSASVPQGFSGTPAYMAPEVLMERTPSPASDIFSLGVVFYEMLTAHHPFLAEGFVATCDRILRELPPPIAELNPGAPEGIDPVISRMLAKDPAHRYRRAADLLADLRALRAAPRTLVGTVLPPRRRNRLLLLALVVLAVAFLTIALTAPGRHQLRRLFGFRTLPEHRHLAVLPFQGTGDPSMQPLCLGLTEVVAAKLTQLTDRYPLQVVPPSEVRVQAVNSVEQAQKTLGVNLVLEGSLHRSGRMVRVIYSLVDAKTRRQLRADTITAEASDPFAMEDRVVGSVLDMLDVELKKTDRKALASPGTTQPEAYDFYLRGRGYLQEPQKPENLDSAETVFRHALERDPNYALAHAGLGETYWRKYELDKRPEWVPQAISACARSAQVAPNLANAHACLGMVYNGTGKYEVAVEEFRRALDLEPTNDDGYRGLGQAYERLNRADDAEDLYQRAIRLRPNYWMGYNLLGKFYFARGRYQDAARQFSQVAALSPDSFRAYYNLGGTYIALGQYADAIPALQRSAAIRPTSGAYSNLGAAYFYQRRFSDAARADEASVNLEARDYRNWGNLAEAYYWAAGERAKAPDAYRKAIALAGESLKVNPRDAITLARAAVYSAMLDDRQGASQYLRRALALDGSMPEVCFAAAQVEARFGRPDPALRWLEKAVAAGLSRRTVRDHPAFDIFRDQARFQGIIAGSR